MHDGRAHDGKAHGDPSSQNVHCRKGVRSAGDIGTAQGVGSARMTQGVQSGGVIGTARSVESAQGAQSTEKNRSAPSLASALADLEAGLIGGADAATMARAARAAVHVSRWAEAMVTEVASTMAMEAGRQLLALAGVSAASELKPTRRERWRAQTKSAVAHELHAMSGWGLQDCHNRVGFALAPRVATEPARQAMSSGSTGWWEVSQWWQRCRELPVADAGAVAAEVFGQRRSRAELRQVLDRAAIRVEGEDAVAAKRRRQRAVATRRAWATVEDNGVATLGLTGRTTAVVAAFDRLDRVARAARGAGDERTLGQLRSDAALTLLMGGTFAAPAGAPGAGSSAHGAGAVSGTGIGSAASPGHPGVDPRTAAPGSAVRGLRKPGPAGSDSLEGHAVASHTAQSHAAQNHAAQSQTAQNHVAQNHAAQSHGVETSVAPADTPLTPSGGPASVLEGMLDGLPPAVITLTIPLDALTGADGTGVSILTGRAHAGSHLHQGEVRELICSPGTTIHRLVTDPVDGHALERSRAGYVPDRAMRDLIRDADMHCRGPGCVVPAAHCDLDHVTPYPSGSTSPGNLASAHRAHHAVKTLGWWQATMDEHRTVTWRTLFGQVYRTHPFDHRQLSARGGRGSGRTTGADGGVPASTLNDVGGQKTLGGHQAFENGVPSGPSDAGTVPTGRAPVASGVVDPLDGTAVETAADASGAMGISGVADAMVGSASGGAGASGGSDTTGGDAAGVRDVSSPDAATHLEVAQVTDADLQDQLLYAALAQRWGADTLGAEEDWADAAGELAEQWRDFLADRAGRGVQVRHLWAGSSRSGPPPGQPGPDVVLAAGRSDTRAGSGTLSAEADPKDSDGHDAFGPPPF